jgi:hypothetical protein
VGVVVVVVVVVAAAKNTFRPITIGQHKPKVIFV